MARIHVVIDDELLQDIDQIAGKRGRSRFIVEAAAREAHKQKLRKAIREGAGIIDASKHPEWATSEKVAQWVHDLRRVPSIRGDPIDRVLAGRKRDDRLAKGDRPGGRPARRARQPR